MYYIDTSKLYDGEKTQCPRCAANGNDKSHDNFHYYSASEGGYCWACNFTIPSEEYKEETSGNFRPKVDKSMITSKDTENLKNKALTPQEVQDIEAKTVTKIPKPYRGVPSEVYEALGVRWEIDGTNVSMYYPITVTEDGSLRVVGYKIRKHPKEFYSVGYVGKLGGFLNQSNAVADTLILVSGEVDLASAVYGLELDKYRKSYNVVSSPLGEDSTATMIKLNYDWVNAHKKIVACMDNDEAGQKAFDKIKEVIDEDKLFKANLELKDLNEYLKNGRALDIAKAIYWSPIPTVTYGIANSGDILSKMYEEAEFERVPLPKFMEDLDWHFNGGFNRGEIINVVAPPSVGKTTVVSELTTDWVINCPYRMLIISMEDSLASYGFKTASRLTGTNMLAMRTPKEKVDFIKENEKIVLEYFYDDNGVPRFDIMDKIPASLDMLKKAIERAVKVNGARVVVLDPLTKLLASKSNEDQAAWMDWEENMVRDYGLIILNVLHTRKTASGQAANSRGAKYNEEDIRGSSTIAGTATITILLNRDKLADCEIERNTIYVDLPKNRPNSKTGEDVAKFFYSIDHHTLVPFSFAEKNDFFRNTTAEQMKDLVKGGYINYAASDVDINEEYATDDNIEIIDSF